MGPTELPFNKLKFNFINSRVKFGEKVLVDSSKETHTHTHTHIYIYIQSSWEVSRH